MERLSESPVRCRETASGGGLHGRRHSVRSWASYSRASYRIVRLQHFVSSKQIVCLEFGDINNNCSKIYNRCKMYIMYISIMILLYIVKYIK